MKVLLLGEFSSLHRYLKEGLEKIGIDVELYSQGDGWKQIPGADKGLPQYKGGGICEYIKYIWKYYLLIRTIKNYDVVQIINTRMFPTVLSGRFIRKLGKNNKCISLVSAGEDYPLVKAYKEGKFDFYMYDFDKNELREYNRKFSNRLVKNELRIINSADIIIPSLYEYAIGYKEYGEKVSKVIPFPINTDNLCYAPNVVKKKIVFFHGLNREASKGTAIIRKAMEKLQEKYPESVEIIIDGHMPFEKYIKIIEKTNVVIDQCLTYGYGINACISMAQGKVVMTPCKKETLEAFGIKESPIINIQADVDQIFSQMEWLVQNKDKITEIGEQSRTYVEEMHDYTRVAQQYLEAWESTQCFK